MINNNWQPYFEEEAKKPYFQSLMAFIGQEYQNKTIFPPYENIYKAFEMCDFNKVKAVIIGQDPYHGVNQAMGLAFAVQKGTLIPPSLKNIFQEIESDLKIKLNPTGDLSKWALEGVLLLNAILTVEMSKPLSHKNKGWEEFTQNILKYLNQDGTPKVFILWGNYAKSYSPLINNPKHLVLTSVHPSPLSSYNGFFNSKPFSKCNEFLAACNRGRIDWTL